jgi:O-antigen ligase
MTKIRNVFAFMLNISLGALAFFLPFEPRFLAIIYIVAIISFLIHKPLNEVIGNLKNHRFQLLLFSSFLLINVLSLAWTENLKAGQQSIDPKMAFLLVPLIFFGSNFQKGFAASILKLFMLSVLISMLVCTVLAVYFYLKTSNPELLYYSEFSRFMHVGYISMYLNFCMVYALNHLTLNRKIFFKNSNTDVWVIFILAIVFQFIVANKTGIITAIILLLYLSGDYFIRLKKLGIFVSIALAIIFIPLLFILIVPGFRARVEQTAKEFRGEALTINEAQSVNIRKQIWKEAWDLGLQRPIAGYGVGDVNDELMKRYSSHKIEFAQKEHLNAHNQFLQTWLSCGILGVMALCSLILLLMPFHRFENHQIIFAFLFIIFLMMLTESIFERQAATVFFALVTCLLTISFSKKTIISHK